MGGYLTVTIASYAQTWHFDVFNETGPATYWEEPPWVYTTQGWGSRAGAPNDSYVLFPPLPIQRLRGAALTWQRRLEPRGIGTIENPLSSEGMGADDQYLMLFAVWTYPYSLGYGTNDQAWGLFTVLDDAVMGCNWYSADRRSGHGMGRVVRKFSNPIEVASWPGVLWNTSDYYHAPYAPPLSSAAPVSLQFALGSNFHDQLLGDVTIYYDGEYVSPTPVPPAPSVGPTSVPGVAIPGDSIPGS